MKHDRIYVLFLFQAGCYKRYQSSSQGFPESERQKHVVRSYASYFIRGYTLSQPVNYKTIVPHSDDIMNYVLERVPPPRPGLPRPRFSLYLSSQLQYGVIVVYHRQCAILLGKKLSPDWRESTAECPGSWLWPCILLEELHTIVGQLVKQATSQKIDMDDYSRWEQVLKVLHICLSLQTQTCCCLSDNLCCSRMLCLSWRKQKELWTLCLEWWTVPVHCYRYQIPKQGKKTNI